MGILYSEHDNNWKCLANCHSLYVCLAVVGYSCTKKCTKSGFSYLYVSQQQENIAPKGRPAASLHLCRSIVTDLVPVLSLQYLTNTMIH